MAVNLLSAEPARVIPIERVKQQKLHEARVRIDFPSPLKTSEQQGQFITDAHFIFSSEQATNNDRKKFVNKFNETFDKKKYSKQQGEVIRLQLGQTLVDNIRATIEKAQTTSDEDSIRTYLKMAKLIDLPKYCSLDKEDKKFIAEYLKDLDKLYLSKEAKKKPKEAPKKKENTLNKSLQSVAHNLRELAKSGDIKLGEVFPTLGKYNWQSVLYGSEQLRDSDNSFRGYLMIDSQDIPRAMNLLMRVATQRVLEGKRTHFKWLQSIHPINSPDYLKFIQDDKNLGTYTGLNPTEPTIALYGDRLEEVREILESLAQIPEWQTIEAHRAAAFGGAEHAPRRPGTNILIVNGQEYRSLNFNDQPGYSEEEAQDPNWRDQKEGSATVAEGIPVIGIGSERFKPRRIEAQKLSLTQRVILGLGAMGLTLGAAGAVFSDARQAVYEAAKSVPGIVRSIELPSFDLTKILPSTETTITSPEIATAQPRREASTQVTPPTGENQPQVVPEGPVLGPQLPPEPQKEDLNSKINVELVPNQIRVLQNPELNRLYREGCIDFNEMAVNGKKVMVLDYMPKPGITCNIKFPQAYIAAPTEGRIRTYQQVDNKDLGITLEQYNATCAINSLVIASMMVNKGITGQESIVVNPLLLAETDNEFTQEIFKQLQQEILNDPALNRQYQNQPDLIRLWSETTPINRRFLAPDLAEKAFKSVFGVTVKRSSEMIYPQMNTDKKSALFQKDMFSEKEWQQLGTQYKLTFNEDGSVIAPSGEAGKVYGKWLENWFKRLKADADKQNKNATSTFNLSFHSTGVNHMYTLIDYQVKDGKGYFRATDGLQGYLSPYLTERGLIKNPDETVLIPVDRLLEIGLNDAFVVSADRKVAPKQNAFERRQNQTSDAIGFRVTDVESIKALPPEVNTIRIAGNQTRIDDRGHIVDPEYDVEGMLKAAKEKGLKVVFVYNPHWFPSLKEPGPRDKPWSMGEVQKEISGKEAQIRAQIRRQLSAVLAFDNVVLEVGNEPTENTSASPQVYWQGDFDTFLKFYELTAEEANKIVKTQKASNPNRPDVTLLAPALMYKKGEKDAHRANYQKMANLFKQLESRIQLPIAIPVHAYDINSLKDQVNMINSVFGNRKIIITEANVPNEDPDSVRKLQEMVAYAQSKNIPLIAHELKGNPALAQQTDKETGLHYVIVPGDAKYRMLSETLVAQVKHKQENLAREQQERPVAAIPRAVFDQTFRSDGQPFDRAPGTPPISVLEEDGTITEV